MNDTSNRRKRCRLYGHLLPAELLIGEHRAFANIVDRSEDGVGLSSLFQIDVKPGNRVRVIIDSPLERHGIVQHIAGSEGELRMGIKWSCAYYRDSAQVDHSATRMTKSMREFAVMLPSALFSLWQLMESDKIHVMSSVIEQLSKAAESAQMETIVVACHSLNGQLLNHGKTSQTDSDLHRLSCVCVSEVAHYATTAFDPSCDEPAVEKQGATGTYWLGAPAWAVGSAASIAGLLV